MTGSWNAELYDDKHSFVWKLASSVVEFLAPQPGERILDLGCGTGQLTDQISNSGAQVVGLDNSPAMIEEACRLYPQLQFRLANAQGFDVPKPFDAVFSNAALHWIKQPEKVVNPNFAPRWEFLGPSAYLSGVKISHSERAGGPRHDDRVFPTG